MSERPSSSSAWCNYILFSTARAKDFPQYLILYYLIARPLKEKSAACTKEGFKEIKGEVEIRSIRHCFLSLN